MNRGCCFPSHFVARFLRVSVRLFLRGSVVLPIFSAGEAIEYSVYDVCPLNFHTSVY